MRVQLVASYVSILRRPGVGRPAAGVVIASVPIGILGLTTLVLSRQAIGSYSGASAIAGALALGTCVGIAVQGRIIDRVGIPRVLLVAASGQTIASAGLIIVLVHHGPGWTAACCALFAGAGEPQVGGSVRALWSGLVAVEQRAAAHALSGLLLEIPVLLAPLVLVVLLSAGGPAVALSIEVALSCVGAVLVASAPAARRWQPPSKRQPRPRRRRIVASRPWRRSALAISVTHAAVGGLVQVAAVAHASAAHIGALIPLVVAALGVGSLIGIALLGHFPNTHRLLPRTVRRMLVAATAVIAMTAVATLSTDVVLLALALLTVGCAFGPISMQTFALARMGDPHGSVAGFGDVIAAGLAGTALGSALSGPLIDHAGATPTLTIAAAIELLGVLWTIGLPHLRQEP